jgi:hypothetical protein
MIGAGLNPLSNNNRRLYNLTGSEFEHTLVLIKQCIYDGFRTNILTREQNNDQLIYSNIWGLKIDLSNNYMVKQIKPYNIITDKIVLNSGEPVKGSTPLIYITDISRVSIVDSFYIPDINILEVKNAFKA